MPKTAWPTGTEAESMIATVPSAISPGTSVCQDIIDGVIEDFQDRTGRIPFLSDAAFSDRTFDPPDGRDRRFTLDIQSASVARVTVGVTPASAGSVLVPGQDYLLDSVNGPSLNKPYERIIFLTSPGCLPQSVVVNAKWGYGPNIPLDAWNAVLEKAVAIALTRTVGLSGPLKTVKQGTVERDYGIRGQRTSVEDWGDNYEDAVSKYTYVPSH